MQSSETVGQGSGCWTDRSPHPSWERGDAAPRDGGDLLGVTQPGTVFHFFCDWRTQTAQPMSSCFASPHDIAQVLHCEPGHPAGKRAPQQQHSGWHLHRGMAGRVPGSVLGSCLPVLWSRVPETKPVPSVPPWLFRARARTAVLTALLRDRYCHPSQFTGETEAQGA